MAVILLVVETRVQVKKKKLMCHKPLNNFDNEEAGKIHFHDNLLSFMKNTKFSTQSIKNVIII
jgi:hypothetical protein